jgi:hypothetical protein
MEKVFTQTKGDFIVSFIEESQRRSYQGINPIAIAFLPNGIMQPYEALEYANDFSDYIVKEAKLILVEHHDFYKNWEIRFSNQFTGTSSVRNDINTNLLATGRVTMNVYCKRITAT